MLDSHRDVRFGLRLMRRRPGFTLLIAVMLAVGIGVNTAVWSVADAFLLRPLPFPAADRLVEVESMRGDSELGVSYADYLDWRERSRSFQDLAFFHSDFAANLTFGGATEPAQATLTTANLFPLLGVPPILGRWLLPEDDRPGAECVALLGESLWKRRFAANPRIVGHAVLLESGACTVVGVMPSAFRFPSQTEVWTSIGPFADRDYRLVRYDSVIGRLRPGVALARANQEIAGVARALAREYPATNSGVDARAEALRDVWVGDVRRPLALLLGACGFLLLMTCANSANLLLGHALGREREIAVRIALGADWRRLAAQLTAEHLILATGSGALGLIFACLGVAALRRAIPVVLPSWVALGVDWTAVGYGAGLSILAALLVGLAPLLQLSKADVTASLKERQAAGGGRSRRWLRSSLVVVQIALALVLLVGAQLMVTSFLRLRQVDPGFRPAGLLAADVNLAFHHGEASAQKRFSQLAQAAVAQVQQLPGVESAAAVVNLPLTGQNVLDRFSVTLLGQSPEAQKSNPVVNFRRVSPDYFKTLGIGLIAGRVIASTDVPGQPGVVVLGEETARRLWPHQNAVGQRLKLGPPSSAGSWYTVQGVVGDVHQESLAGAPGCDLYVSIFQAPGKLFTVLARTKGDPAAFSTSLRRALAATSPEIGVAKITTLQDVVAHSIWVPRLWGLLFALFSLLSLLLAAAGIYGLMAASVRERTREIGLRLALGAQPRGVVTLILEQGLKLALTGAAIGLCLAAVLSRLLSSFLFEVDPATPWPLLEVATFLVSVALLACWIASRKASAVDPLIALRHE